MNRTVATLLLVVVVGGPMTVGILRAPAGAARASPLVREHDPLLTRLNDEGQTGEVVYLRYCGGCHGVTGDGRGPAAPFLSPRPRDFTSGVYKFTSTPAGSPPLDDDLLRTITEGLRGTSMPSWRFLPLNQRKSLVRYVLGFHKEWRFRTVEPAIPFHENPVDMSDRKKIEAAVAGGREVYHKKTACWACHPAYMEKTELEALLGGPARTDLQAAIAKPDQWGETILPPDFPSSTLKSVKDLKSLYTSITAGVGGTAMPTWKGTLSGPELWSLVLFVDSLRPELHSTVKRTIRKLREEEGK